MTNGGNGPLLLALRCATARQECHLCQRGPSLREAVARKSSERGALCRWARRSSILEGTMHAAHDNRNAQCERGARCLPPGAPPTSTASGRVKIAGRKKHATQEAVVMCPCTCAARQQRGRRARESTRRRTRSPAPFRSPSAGPVDVHNQYGGVILQARVAPPRRLGFSPFRTISERLSVDRRPIAYTSQPPRTTRGPRAVRS